MRTSFDDEVLDLKLRCCDGQLSPFAMVTISTSAISRVCHWKRSELPVTSTQVEREKVVTTLVTPYSTDNRSA